MFITNTMPAVFAVTTSPALLMETPTKVPGSVWVDRVPMVLEIRCSRPPLAATIVLPAASATTSMGVPATVPEVSTVSAAFSRCTSLVVEVEGRTGEHAWAEQR